jgi:sugar phosphate isomerase/epimerase
MVTSRRAFLSGSAGLGAAAVFASRASAQDKPAGAPPAPKKPVFEISLAEWSLHRALEKGELSNLDFPAVAKRDYGIAVVEYVNKFFKDKARDAAYLAELKKRCDDNGVTSHLIMCDDEGALAASKEEERLAAVEKHKPWVDAAKALGCRTIRVNANGDGEREARIGYAADGLVRLAEYADPLGINVIVENHGGFTSDGSWLAAVMKKANHPRVGTLPDFGNFDMGDGKKYDRYKGVKELMPFAKAVSAKSYDFDAKGNETTIDYREMLGIVIAAGYRSWIGIEYEGDRLPEKDGILRTKELLVRIATEFSW